MISDKNIVILCLYIFFLSTERKNPKLSRDPFKEIKVTKREVGIKAAKDFGLDFNKSYQEAACPAGYHWSRTHLPVGWSCHFIILFIFMYTHSGAENGVKMEGEKKDERKGGGSKDGEGAEYVQRSSIRGVASPAPSVELGIDRTAGLLLLL